MTTKLRRPKAFTLVEVTMALGIFSISVLAVIALLPEGLNAHRESMSRSILADLMRKFSNELQQTPFDDLQTDLTFRYYDANGTEVNTRDEANYGMRFRVTNQTQISGQANPYMKTVQVEFFTLEALNASADNPDEIRYLYITDNGLD